MHRPSRGRHSRSRSHSRSGSLPRNAHSIEIDRYDIDDIDVLRTFNSISRSRSVAAISNDTDPDGKTKILTKLRAKLPYQNIADIMEVKVDDRAKANILPLHTFRSMFPHKLDEDSYLKDDALRGSQDNAPMLRRWQAGESRNDHTTTEAICERFISRPSVFHC